MINILNFYRLLMSDFISPNHEKAGGVEWRMTTSESLDQAVKSEGKGAEGGTASSNGFHPVTVNRFVTSLFNPDEEDGNEPPLDHPTAKKFN